MLMSRALGAAGFVSARALQRKAVISAPFQSGVAAASRGAATATVTATAPVAAATFKSAGHVVPFAGQRAVGYWLMGSAGMVFGMVMLGGVTRLTR